MNRDASCCATSWRIILESCTSFSDEEHDMYMFCRLNAFVSTKALHTVCVLTSRVFASPPALPLGWTSFPRLLCQSLTSWIVP